jgi:hypothetical protein
MPRTFAAKALLRLFEMARTLVGGWAAQREASSTLVTGKSQTSMIHAGAPRRCLPALELWLERLGRSRSATKAVFRSSCRMSIEVPKSRRNPGNGVNYSASCHTIRRTEKNQGNQGCILGSASCPFVLISVSQAAGRLLPPDKSISFSTGLRILRGVPAPNEARCRQRTGNRDNLTTCTTRKSDDSVV